MTTRDVFEARFERALRSYSARAVVPFDPAMVAERAMHAPPRRSWLSMVLVPAILVGLLVAMAIGVATFRPSPPPPRPQPSDTTTLRGGELSRAASAGHAAVLLADGRIFIFGGSWVGSGFGGPTSTAEIFDPVTGDSHEQAASPEEHRAVVTGTPLPDGRVLIVGGYGGLAYPNTAVAAAEVWDPGTGEFEQTGRLAEPRVDNTATSLPDGRVLIVGGSGHQGLARGAEVYDPQEGTFSTAGELAVPRTGHTATLLADGRVLVVGGIADVGDPEDGDSRPTSVVELWDPATGSFTVAGDLGIPRFAHTATLLGDGRVLVIGGKAELDNQPGEADEPIGNALAAATAETWDPATGSFSASGALTEPRHDHSATLLSDGDVAVIGGAIVPGDPAAAPVALDTVELWQPDTGSFRAGPSLDEPRSGHSAVRMSGDRILLIGGGYEPDGLRSVEVWRPE